MDAPDVPRIRTLKPEHKAHRKVGLLSDRAYRLWVGLVTEADDEGRFIAEPSQLLASVFPYQRRLREAQVEGALGEIAATGLVGLYVVTGTRYGVFPSWPEHQRISHPVSSALPTPPEDSGAFQKPPDSSGLARARGSDRIGSEGNGVEGKGSGGEWPAPAALVRLYNELSPDECPSVETLSPERRRKAREFLQSFPEESWWREAFAQMHRSPFLRGKVRPKDGRKPFVADLDWLLSRGQDKVENIVKVADGKYRDG